jgi:ABC-type multidrug transport system ATPase subunit
VKLDRIEARRVSKIFDRQRAVYDVDVEVRSGEVLALLGPNGAGKTTLLGLLSSLSRPSRGDVRWLAGDRPLAIRDVRAQLAWVAHETFTYDELTGFENLELYARLQGLDDPRAEANAWVERVALTEAKDRNARTYSRGMRQRLALARALIGRPRALLLDEPFSGLDGPSTEHVFEIIRAIKAEGTALILVTHDISQAAELSDRFLILRAGQVRARVEHPLETEALRRQMADVVEVRVAS